MRLGKLLNYLPFFWLLLALPGFAMLNGYWTGRLDAEAMLHPTGEFSARFMIVAMMISPMIVLFGPARWLQWLMKRRRALGVAAFIYALAHAVFYVIDMELLSEILKEATIFSMWTGWLAFVIFTVMAITSNEASVRALKRNWKTIQRFVYAAAVLTMLHWIYVHGSWKGAAVHFAPLALLELARIVIILKKRSSNGKLNSAIEN